MKFRSIFSSVAAALLAASLAFPASATTVLLGCDEDSCFSPTGANAITTTVAGTFRTGWSRESLEISNDSAAADPPANFWHSPLFPSAVSSVWIHAVMITQNTGGSNANVQGLRVYSPDGVARILLRQTATFGQIKVSSRTAAGVITDLATASANFTAGTTLLDLFINYTCSGAGGIQLYENGTQVINFTGNPCTDAATTLNAVDLAQLSGSSSACTFTTTAAATCWSEFIAQDTSTIGEGLLALTPTGAGNTQNWVPNTLANINKTANNDATSIATTTTGVLSEWTQGTAIPTGSFGVVAVTQDVRAERGTSGPQTILPVVRTAGSDFTGSSFSPGTVYSNFNLIWPTNPATSAAWATTDITAPLQYGMKSNP